MRATFVLGLYLTSSLGLLIVPEATLAQGGNAVPSPAADPDDDAVNAGGGLAEIVVTAQRRAESLQSVPISVTAVTADKLEASGITSTQDLPNVAPGLIMTNVRNTVTPYLRGIGTQAGTAGTEGAIAVYIDGVYLPNAISSAFSLNNVQRVEVLKGPQGTLFGRNATGGLIHVFTRDPTYNPELRATLGYGNYDTKMASFYVTGGLTENVAADFAFYGSHQGDGWGRNLILGGDVNFRREALVRSKIKAELGERTSVVLAGDYARWRSDIGNVFQPLPGTVSVGRVTTTGSIYDLNSPHQFPSRDSEQYGGSLVITHALTDDIEVQSTSAYRKHDAFSATNTDGTPAVLNDSRFHEVGDSFQQEILLNGKTGALIWTAGAFYFDSSAGFRPFQFSTTPPSPNNANRNTETTTKSYSTFAQGTYELAPATNLTLGARYTYDRKAAFGQFIATAGNTVPAGTVIVDVDNLPRSQTRRHWDAVTWRIAIDHQLQDNVLAYASMNRGFKSGAFNAADTRQPALNPERLDAYEIGIKSDLLDRTLRFNAAAFYYDYKNIQLQVITGTGSQSFNAPSGRVKGLDVETTWAPRISNGNLEISGSVSLLDTEYLDFPSAPHTILRDPSIGGRVATSTNAKGNEMVRAPNLSSSVTLDYSTPITDVLEAGGNVSWQHNGKFYWEVNNDVYQKAYDIINAQIFLGKSDSRWRVRLWARNLLDEKYFVFVNTNAFGATASAAAPRTYGIALDLKFGG